MSPLNEPFRLELNYVQNFFPSLSTDGGCRNQFLKFVSLIFYRISEPGEWRQKEAG